jgi:uncharacterized protein YuzE
MKVEYDQQADALYIALAREIRAARTVQVDPGTLVDLDDNGQLLGVEVIRPARSWPLDEILRRFPTDPADALVLRLLELNAVRMFAPTPSSSSAPAEQVQLVSA